MNTTQTYDYKGLANEVELRGITLADTFEEWTKLAMSLAELGEQGREIFHQLSSMSEGYNRTENERKFSNACRTGQRVHVASFIQMCKEHGIDTKKYCNRGTSLQTPVIAQKRAYKPQQYAEPSVIPHEYVERSRSNKNTLLQYLCSLMPMSMVYESAEAYKIGSTRHGGIIYWQIDVKGRTRTGKVMLYDAISGHRIKDEATPNKVTWVHSLMIKKGLLKESWKDDLRQCLFGEHLLADEANRGRIVAVVEAEKTALIASIFIPNYVWVACGGEMMFSEHRLKVLSGRRVIAFPDAHPEGESYRKWCEVASRCTFCTIEVSGILEREASSEEKEQKIDIADWLLREACNGMSEDRRNLNLMLEANPSLRLLIDKLQLELVEDEY